MKWGVNEAERSAGLFQTGGGGGSRAAKKAFLLSVDAETDRVSIRGRGREQKR